MLEAMEKYADMREELKDKTKALSLKVKELFDAQAEIEKLKAERFSLEELRQFFSIYSDECYFSNEFRNDFKPYFEGEITKEQLILNTINTVNKGVENVAN